MGADQLRLSIVVPAFNEAERLVDEAERLHQAVVAGAIDPSSTELIVVDDGSSDNTAHRSEIEFGRSFTELRVLRRKVNSGKGAAIRDGIAAARAPVVLFMDADMAVDPLQTPLLVSAIDHADVAIGSRSVPGSSVQSDNFRRAVMGRTFSRYVNTLTEMGIRDTQCGFKAFRTPVARLLFHCMVIDRFAFDVELLYLAQQLHFRVAEVPVDWRDVDGSAVRPIVDPFSMVIDVLRLRMGRKSPPIPALSVSSGSSAGEQSTEAVPALLSGAFGNKLPLVHLDADHTLVLFPLCGTDDIRGARERVHALVPGVEAIDRLVSVSELADLGPTSFRAPPEADSRRDAVIHLSTHDSPSHQDQESLPLPGT